MKSAGACYRFGDFCLDTARRRLDTLRGEPVAIPARAFDVLITLVERRGTPVSRRELIETVWHDTVVGENALSQAIAALRRACGEGCIVTVPRRGYQFVGDVHDAPVDARTGAPSPFPPPPPTAGAPAFRRRGAAWLAGIVAAGLAAWALWPGQELAPATPEARGPAGPAALARQHLQYGIDQLRSDKDVLATELAARELEVALRLDPGLAEARIHLATSYRHLMRLAVDPETENRYAALLATALERATDAARDRPEIFGLLVEELTRSKAWREAAAVLRERLDGGGDFSAVLAYGTFLSRTGHLDDALAVLERARAMRPDDLRVVSRLADVHDALGQPVRARDLRHDARGLVGYSIVASAPHFWQLLAAGDTRAARASFVEAQVILNGLEPEVAAQMLSPDAPPVSMPAFGPPADAFNRVWTVGLRHLDNRAQGAAALRALPERDTGMGTVAGELNLAEWAAYFEEPALGLRALGRAADGDPAMVLDILLRPVMAPVRRHSGFAQLMRDLELIEYWATAGYPTRCRPSGPAGLTCT